MIKSTVCPYKNAIQDGERLFQTGYLNNNTHFCRSQQYKVKRKREKGKKQDRLISYVKTPQNNANTPNFPRKVARWTRLPLSRFIIFIFPAFFWLLIHRSGNSLYEINTLLLTYTPLSSLKLSTARILLIIW